MQAIKKILNRLPYIRSLALYSKHQSVPPGHYYSPIVDPSEIAKYRNSLYDLSVRTFPGIDLNEKSQLDTLESFVPFYKEIPSAWTDGGMRYNFNNEFYSCSDGIMLYSMMRKFTPSRIVEVGSGYTSALMLDTNEIFMNNNVELTFIEPYPERLNSLIRKSNKATVLVKPLQDIGLSVFEDLRAGDFLFIDSSHVAKTGSDVNRIFFEILPNLQKGVFIHFHDIFHPFEYPEYWATSLSRNWNELYMLRSFLSFNDSFRIVMYNTFMEHFHNDWFKNNMPLCLKNPGGSIWIEKVG
jgi:predicted O-methyltransferase YrrM